MKPSHVRILSALATYKFLTTLHMLDLGILSDRNNINRELGVMRRLEKPLIKTVSFSVDPVKGRLPSYHYLTASAKKFLIDELGYYDEDIKLPSGKVDFSHIYHHHTQSLDIEIAMRSWMDTTKQEVVVCDRYFDRKATKGGSRAKSSFQLPSKRYVNPDMVLLWLNATQVKRLVLLELHRGADLQKLSKQLADHALLLQYGIPSKHFHDSHGLKRGYRLLVVLEQKSLLKSAKNRLHQHLGRMMVEYDPFFLFKTLHHTCDDFAKGWQTVLGESIDL